MRIVKIEPLDGPLDPLSLPSQLQRLAAAGTSVSLVLQTDSTRDSATDKDETQSIKLTPRIATWLESSETEFAPVSIPELGLAYQVENEVAAVVPGSPAAEAGLAAGDKLTSATLMVPEPDSGEPAESTIELGDARNWPMLVAGWQILPEPSHVKLSYERAGRTHEVTLTPAAELNGEQFNVDRGFVFEPVQRIRIAATFTEQLQLGWNETIESLSMVYRFLQKIGGQVPLTALGGPITIAKAAGASAFEGFPKFLIFLTMLSANLAVINFLPIPILDGGHMVFLAYEGIFRRPANEKVVVALHTAGFAFIVGLMLFVFGLDLGIIPRNL
jgi:regulator of sigma E protease